MKPLACFSNRHFVGAVLTKLSLDHGLSPLGWWEIGNVDRFMTILSLLRSN